MEVRIDVINQAGQLYCTAYFVMVARNLEKGISLPVPKISWEREIDLEQKNEARLRFSLGAKRQEARKDGLTKSLAKTPPEPDESKVVHDIFLAKHSRKHIWRRNQAGVR